MCKSQAEGGRRCAFHATKAVSTAVVSAASAETGLRHQAAVEAFADLQAEGQHLAAPSRYEVDGWLADQEFRARHSVALSDHKRASILARLRAAIGRATPDGGTWYAWRHSLAECWSRTRRKVAVVLVAGSLATGLGACGTTDSTPRDATPVRPVATAPASPSVSTVNDPAIVERGQFAGEPVQVFGQERVDGGYAAAADFAENGFAPALLAGAPQTAEFEDLTNRMTLSAADDYRTTVQRALAGDSEASSALMTAAFYDIRGDGFALATDGSLVTNQTIGAPTVAVDRSTGVDRLQVTLHQRGDLRGTLNGAPVRVPMDKDVTYWLAPTESGWLVDGWTGTWTIGEPVPGN